MLRTLFWWAVFIPATSFIAVFSVLAALFDRSGDSSHRFNRLWAKLTMWASASSIEVIGEDNLLKDRGQIIVSNHQSGFDIYSLTACLPLQIRWLSKESLFRIPLMGWAMSASRYIPIDRDNPRKALKSLKKAENAVKKGYSVIIFPEGTRTRDGNLQEFKKGTLYIAKKGKLPITPLTILGTFDIMKKGSIKIRPSRIKVIIDPSIPYEDIEGKSEQEVLARLYNTIESNLNK
jgi:1-acyl-sn-glycerol-3-phosphate acyltransferase